MYGEDMAFERVSIAMTCYNAEDTIERSVRSAMAQNWPDLEILVLDDCSSDQSRQVLERLAAEDPRIRILVQTENMGVGAARNGLLEEATGTFVAFFDDDDWSHPDRIATQVQRIRQYEVEHQTELAACYTARLQYLPDGTQRIVNTIGEEDASPCHGASVVDLILMGRPLAWGRSGQGACATCSLLARRAVFNRVGGYDPQFRRSEDTEFNARLALAGGHFVGIARPLVEQKISQRVYKTVVQETSFTQLLLRKHQDALPSQRWYKFMSSWIDIRSQLAQGHRANAALRLLRLAITHPDHLLRKLFWIMKTRVDLSRRSSSNRAVHEELHNEVQS